MGGKVLRILVAAAALAAAGTALAGGGGFRGGGIRIPAGHAGGMRWAGGAHWAGGGWRGGQRSLPPVAGVIHERPGMRPFYSAYGHLNTGYVPFAAGLRGGWRYGPAGYGHLATASRGYGEGRYGRERFGRYAAGGRWDRVRLAGGRRVAVFRGGYLGGGFGGAYDGGFYAAPGAYATPGAYVAPGGYDDGHYGTEAGGAAPYVTEPPLAATQAEPPLAPSPYGPDGGTYAPQAGGAGPRIIRIESRSRASCDCAPPSGALPTIYRYGVGTAY